MDDEELLERVVLPYLHLARRGAMLALGYQAVKQSLAHGRCRLIVRARDAGAALRRLDTGSVPVLELVDKRRLGDCCGRSELSVLGIESAELAAGMLGRLEGT
jgi:ribosomal protein L7Ae-like RNA K-turn-binding protein